MKSMPVFCRVRIGLALLLGSLLSSHGLATEQEVLSQPEWTSIQESLNASQHKATQTSEGFLAKNPGQAWTIHFDGTGFLVQPETQSWTWGLQLQSYGFVGALRTFDHAPECKAQGGEVTYAWNENLSEWYINDSRGLEHGYDLKARPQGHEPGAPLTFQLEVQGTLDFQIQPDGHGVTFQSDEHPGALNYSGLLVLDARGRKQPSTFLRQGSSLVISIGESESLYPLVIDPLAYQAYLKASNTDAGDLFGSTVAISGNTLVVGAPEESSSGFGVNGNQSDNISFGSGAAYVFVRNGSTWSQQAYLKASDPDPADGFGTSVAIFRDRIVVGAPNEDSSITINGNGADNSAPNSGAAYVFERVGTTWIQTALLKGALPGLQDHFGGSVAIAGDRILVGAIGEDSNATGINGNTGNNSASGSGAAFLFEPQGNSWALTAYIKASNTDAGDEFGSSVSIDGDRFVVGAPFEKSQSSVVNGNQSDNSQLWRGAAYLYEFNGVAWTQQAYLKGDGKIGSMLFGSDVDISGTTVVVAAAWESGGGLGIDPDPNATSSTHQGAAFIFGFDGTAWFQDAYVKGSNSISLDFFGTAVAAFGNQVMVGSRLEWSTSSGINGSQDNAGSSGTGAAYLFERGASSWQQTDFIKATNSFYCNYFGTALAMSAGYSVIGAYGDPSHATGVNSFGNSNLAPNSGAAYVVHLDSPSGNFCGPAAINGAGLSASISYSGSLLVSDNAFTLHANDLPQNQTGYFLNSRGIAYIPMPGGSLGNLCLGGGQAIGRHNRSWEVRNSGLTGSVSLTLDLQDLPFLQAAMPGETWNFQCWFRDSTAPGASNFTDGLAVRFN